MRNISRWAEIGCSSVQGFQLDNDQEYAIWMWGNIGKKLLALEELVRNDGRGMYVCMCLELELNISTRHACSFKISPILKHSNNVLRSKGTFDILQGLL